MERELVVASSDPAWRSWRLRARARPVRSPASAVRSWRCQPPARRTPRRASL